MTVTANNPPADNPLGAGPEADATAAPEPEVVPSSRLAQRRARMRRFVARAVLIFLPGLAYVGWRLLPDLPLDLAGKVAGGFFLAACAVFVPFAALAQIFLDDQKTADRLVWIGALGLGWISSLFIFTLLRDAAMWVPAARAYAPESALAVIGLSVLVSAVGFANARRIARVVRVDIPIDGLADALHGFTIAQISDIHVGPTIKAGYVRAIVDKVNATAPDLIAVTGDVVDGKVERLAGDTAPLGDLRARHGAFVVTGNHEYYSGADAWLAEFRRLGLRTLMNEHVVVDHDGAPLVVAGINDYSAQWVEPSHGSDPQAALADSPAGAPKILLAHQPRSVTAAAAAGADVQLSGHTHGGQFWPWTYFVRMQQPFTAGLHRVGATWVYTSRGTGYWGPPKRFGAPSEITVIRLVPAA